jgi:PLD-like domain
MHAKYFAFSRAGKARYITMVGSNNLTQYNAEHQWSDLYTVTNDEPYFKAFKPWFSQLSKDTPVAAPYLHKQVGAHQIWVTPLDLTVNVDPLLTTMSTIRCQVPMGELDPDSPTPDAVVATRLRIATHAWNGNRGVALANRVAELQDQGCLTQVFYYDIGSGSSVRTILAEAGVAMNPGTVPGVHTHHKLMIISGAVDGELSTTRVVTGSQNWSNRALPRDDIILEIAEDSTGAAYIAAFDRMWRIG